MNAFQKLSVAGVVALLLSGCHKGEEAAAAAAASASAAAAAASAAPAPTVASADLPTTEDFEQQAQDEINPQNMDQELDKLEKEITQ